MTNDFPRGPLEAALDNMDIDHDAIHEAYSGRGMYGDTCFGLALDDDRELPVLGIELARQAHYQVEAGEAEGLDGLLDDLVNLFDRAQTDSLGRGAIVYFPGWALKD